MKKIFLIAALFCLFSSKTSFAACVSPNTFTVTQTAALGWSTWAVPSGSVTGVISSAGVTSGTGTQIYGVKTAGNYLVKKNSNNSTCATVNFSITASNCNAPGCTLSAFRGSWNGAAETAFPISSATMPPNGGLALKIGATATYDNTVTIGSKVPTYTIGMHYDALADQTFPESASIGFDTPLSIDTIVGINFGVVKAATAGTYTISTLGVVTPTLGGVVLGGHPVAGSMLIHGATNDTITISTGSYVAGGVGNGVTLSAATCSYNGGAETACDAGITLQTAPTSIGKSLKLGVKAVVNASQTAGTIATPSFTVTVSYT
jgi:hypothetical protein